MQPTGAPPPLPARVQLELCEKALQDYLETKRIAFPRFYFVAPADLLDILSKGSNPQAILRRAMARAAPPLRRCARRPAAGLAQQP